MGPVTLTTALANSLNTVSVRLILEVGPSAVARTAYRLGIDSKLDPNPSLALGTSGVSPLELVSAYAPFANGGFAAVPHAIERIKGTDGSILYARATQAVGRIVDARYVAMMNSMLHETIASGTARHADLPVCPRRAKPEPATTHGLPDSPAICSAWSGWAMTITPTSRSKARTPPRLSGPSS